MSKPINYRPSRDPESDLFMAELARLKANLGSVRALEFINGFLEQGSSAVPDLLDRLNTPVVQQGIENFVHLISIVAQLDPQLLTSLANASKRAAKERRFNRTGGLIQIIKSVGSPQSRRGISIIFAFLTGLGEPL